MKKMYKKSILGIVVLSATASLSGCGSNNIPIEPVNAKTLEFLNKQNYLFFQK
jgi:hypothetical protein